MALSIKNEELDRRIRRLSELTGQGITTSLRIALDAFRRYGKGQHPAKLNFGDCISYALAKPLDAPLLFKGNDFARTDIVSAL